MAENKLNGRQKDIIDRINKTLDLEIDTNSEIYKTTMRANKVYYGILKKYLSAPAVIEFNTIAFIKQECKKFTEKKQLDEFIQRALDALNAKEKLTNIDKIELRVFQRFHEAVCLEKGRQYVGAGFNFTYDDQIVSFDPIAMNDEETELKESETKGVQ